MTKRGQARTGQAQRPRPAPSLDHCVGGAILAL